MAINLPCYLQIITSNQERITGLLEENQLPVFLEYLAENYGICYTVR